MLLWPALFAEVLFGRQVLRHDTHASSMLPHCAAVAENEEFAGVLSLRIWDARKSFAEWWTRVLLHATYASCYLFIVHSFLIRIVDSLVRLPSIFVFVGSLRSLAATRRLTDVFR